MFDPKDVHYNSSQVGETRLVKNKRRLLRGGVNTVEDFRPGTQKGTLKEEKSVVEKLYGRTCG
jgi:hypothetical protein